MAEKIKGRVSGVESKSGTKKDGDPYEVSVVSLTKQDGVVMKLSTFDVDAAKKSNGKSVEIEFVKSGIYHNIVKEGIKILGEGEQVKVSEESLVTNKQATAPKETMTKADGNSGDYVSGKDRQTSIVRQSSINMANNYIGNILKAAELGIIEKEKLTADEFTIESVLNIAHKFEKDVTRD